MKRLSVGIALGIAFPAPVPALAATPMKLSLRAAVDKALESNVEVRKSRESLAKAEVQRSNSFRALAPTVNAKSTFSTKADSINYGYVTFDGRSYNFYQAGLEARWQILQGAGLWAEQSKQAQDEAIARLNLQIAERDLSVKLIEAYFKVRLIQKKVDTYQRMDNLLKEFVGTSSRRERLGTERKSVVLRFRTEQALNAPKVLQARNELIIAATTLAFYFNDRNIGSLDLSDSLDGDWLEKLAVKATEGWAPEPVPEVRRGDLQIERQANERQVKMAPHWPGIELFGDYLRTATKFSNVLDPYSASWNYGVNLTIPLFSGLSSLTERRLLANDETQIRLDAAGARNTAALNLATSTEDLKLYREQLRTAREALKLAQESLRVHTQDYAHGLNVYQDLFDARRNLVEAELQVEQTQLDYMLALARNETANGRSLSDWMKSFPEN